MAPRRGSKKSSAMAIDSAVVVEEAIFLDSLSLGGYEQRLGWFVEILACWSSFLLKMIKVSPSGLVAWESLKRAFLKYLAQHPRRDPWLDRKEWGIVDSAEELASGVRRMLESIRQVARCAKKKVVFFNILQ